MNKSMVGGVVIGVAVAAGGAAVASYGLNQRTNSAEVLAVTPVTKTVHTPHEVCEDVQVTKQRPVKDDHQIAGTALGAIVGGVLGHQVGGGTGRELATVAGAAAGGYAGNRVEKHIQDKNTYTETQNRCHTVQESKQETVGYDVRYRLGETVDHVRMRERPGDRIPVKDGRLLINEEPAHRS